NPSLHKDFSILVVDGGSGIGNGRVFPAGPLRASLDAQLARAQALLVIGEDRHGIAGWGAASGGLPVFHGTLVPDAAALAALRGQRLLAYAGIGAPAKFFGTLHAAGLDVAETAAFPDHHRFTDADIADLLRRADRGGLTPVSTEKDCVRLAGNPAAAALAARTLALPVTLAVQEQDAFAALVRDGLGAARAGRVSS
ncbi:MAG TPA: tetraacyldisaccharide 4'-kinase, partial [Xanthobacteraceae bacterium]|nr:tetraacyldisaccharide 4'-kinase [Xanthobacteraceae bacterium]